jgi:uncharacterized protein (TIGR00297 family)
MPRSIYSEDLRQVEHLFPISFAFLLKFLSWPQALAMAFCALLYGAFISGRFWPPTQRPEEKQAGFSPGKVIYAISIIGLILLFPDEMYIVAAVWANLSVGDAVSNLVGRNFGRARLPWNREKTWLGLFGALVSSSMVAFLLILWTGFPTAQRHPVILALIYAVSCASVCSFTETLPLPIDDNLTICLAGAAWLGWLTRASWPESWNWRALGAGLAICILAAAVAWLLKTVSLSGVFWGIPVGSVIYFSLGPRGFTLLATFFVLGSLFSRMGYKRKHLVGVAQDNWGRRSGRHIWGKGVAAFMAAIAALFMVHKELALLAYVAALSTSLFDTTATELGQLLGKRPVSMATLKPVPRGTPGAVSLAGSSLGLAAGAIIVGEGYVFGLVTLWGALWAMAAAVIAAHLEGYLVSRHSAAPVSGAWMNALHTTVAMLIALVLARIRL